MLKIEIIGNLGSDAKLENRNGREYVSFNVAHSEKVTINGQVQERTTWVSCFRNGNLGGLLQYLTKGKSVFVRGNMSLNQYQDRNGNWQTGITCNVDEVQLCGNSGGNSANDANGNANGFANGDPFAPGNDNVPY